MRSLAQRAGTYSAPSRAATLRCDAAPAPLLSPSRRTPHPACGERNSARLGEIDLGGAGEATSADVFGVGRGGAADLALQVGVAADELRRPVEQAEHVVDHQHLTVAAGRGADADGRHADGFGDFL